MTSLTVLGVGGVMVTLSFELIGQWSITAPTTASATFLSGIYWQTTLEYLPVSLVIAQILVVLALASPWVLFEAHWPSGRRR